MSSKRKQSSLSQSSGSGSDLSDAGKDMKMLATKKQKQSSYVEMEFDVVRGSSLGVYARKTPFPP